MLNGYFEEGSRISLNELLIFATEKVEIIEFLSKFKLG
jgi:hypothetical protein